MVDRFNVTHGLLRYSLWGIKQQADADLGRIGVRCNRVASCFRVLFLANVYVFVLPVAFNALSR